jgi:hypothetical protein
MVPLSSRVKKGSRRVLIAFSILAAEVVLEGAVPWRSVAASCSTFSFAQLGVC